VSWKLLSVLLQYPEDELLDALPELERDAAQLPSAQRAPVERFLRHLGATAPAALRAEYVEAFDFDRRAALHLTWHTHGDRRQRGIELVRLKRHYAEAGLPLADGELPDYLPVLLEFAGLRPDEGIALLVGLRPSLELVRAALHERQSPYAGLLDAVCVALPKATARQLEQARKLALAGPPAELVGLEPFTAPEAVGAGL
jgi:nitrate reductase delta subunit